MDIQQLCGVLQACMSPDQAQRTAAEAALKQLEGAPGQAVNLLRVAAEASVDAAVRQNAAITFKNMCKRCWEPSENDTTTPRIPAEDKQVVRDNLLEALIHAPHPVQVQLGEVLKLAVHVDYPHAWPTLLPALNANLVSQDAVRVHGGLYALRIVARRYEFRDEDERQPMVDIINTTFPVLLHIFQQLLSSPATVDSCQYMKLVAKTFWSCTYMGVPDKLLEPEQFNGWMTAVLTAINQPTPEAFLVGDPEDWPSSSWWKSRKWLYHIAYRFVSRYGIVKNCREGNDMTFGKMFQGEVAMRFLDAMLSKIKALHGGAYMSPRVTNMVFQYVCFCLHIKEAYKHVGAHWDEILIGVAFPLMCFSKEDQRLWVEDPHEYIRKGYDILEDMYSPKTAVANFAHELCEKKKSHLDRFLNEMVGILSQFHGAAAAGGGQVADPLLLSKMDGALLAIGVLHDVLKDKKPYKNQLGAMLMNFVLPCFTSPYGHLRSKAVWVAGVYCDCKFPDGEGAGPSFNALFEKAVGLLADPDLPVRVDTVVALRQFIDAAQDTDSLKPVLPTLLSHIFHLMNEIDAEDLVFSLESLVEKFGHEIAPYAAQMVQQLAAAYDKYTNTQDEDDEDADDMAAMAAFGCLRAINTLLESVSGLGPELYPSLEAALYPMLYKLISSEGQDVMEEVLEILSYLTFFGPGITPRLWSLWPRIHNMLMEFGIDYWENLLVPLDNMITRDTATFVGSKDPDYLTSAFQMVSHSLTADYVDREVVCAVRLLEVILQACRGQVDQWVAPFIQLVLQRLARTETRCLKDTLVLLVADALYYNPVLALQALGGLGAVQSFFSTWFGMIMANKASGKMKHFRRMCDKKVCVLGLLSLLSLPDEQCPPEVVHSRGLLLTGVTRLLTAHKQQEEEKAAEVEDDDEEDEDNEDEEEGAEDWGDDEEEEDTAGDDYMKRLEKRARELLGNDDDDDDSDDEFTDDEEIQTAIDAIDPFILLADTLAGIAAQQPAKYAVLQQAVAVDPAVQANLQAALAVAETKRAEIAKKAAAPQ